jgi:aminoglycoside phosphotransferase family enzyme
LSEDPVGNDSHDSTTQAAPPTEAKVQFLLSPEAYPPLNQSPTCVETHMSWLFFAGDRVLKLKKPVRYPFLDFSSVQAREFYCREEVRLNARLAPGVYLGVLALQASDGALALLPESRLPAPGRTVDWLVQMRRLPHERTLLRCVLDARVEPHHVDALVAVLVNFYRSAAQVTVSGPEYLAHFQHEQAANRDVLLRPQFELRDAGLALDRFDAALTRWAGLLDERARGGRVVDGHGDLRPDHVYLMDPPVVIDCLEFNTRLRQVDPFDEVMFLSLECDIAGAPWIGPRLLSGCVAALGDTPPGALLQLYTAHRALLRARLAMAHLLDPVPRTPLQWPRRAQPYLERAQQALERLASPSPH